MDWILFAFAVLLFGGHGKCLSHGRRVLCYMDFWAIYDDVMELQDLEPAMDKCTHLVFMHADIDKRNLHVVATNPGWEIDNGGYKRVVALREKFPHLKILLCIGGKYETSQQFTDISRDENERSDFVRSTVDFVKLYGFDGIEIRWYHPGIPPGHPGDKENFVLLSKQMKEEFDKNDLIYTTAIAGRKRVIDAGVDGLELSKYVHFLTVSTVEYHNYGDGILYTAAPLYGPPGEDHNADYVIQYLLKMGINPGILNFMVGSYFTTYILKTPLESNDSVQQIVGRPILRTTSFQGPLTKGYGYISPTETCALLDAENSTWKIIVDNVTRDSFAVSGDRVIALETEETFTEKVKYAMENKLGGISFFGLDVDDFHAVCKSSKKKIFPFLSYIDNALKEQSEQFLNKLATITKVFSSNFFWKS